MDYIGKFLKFEHTDVMNFVGAFRGMRNPLNSWAKSDSHINPDGSFCIGPNDLNLATQLIKGGSEHRKFLQQIFVCVDITGCRSFWQEADTYRVGITKNSCSTMHKIQDHLLDTSDFELGIDQRIIDIVNEYVAKYQQSKDIEDLRILKSQLPEGFLQKRTVTMNYENLLNIYRQRHNHRLPHWREDYMTWLKGLPYMNTFLEAVLEKEN